MIDLATGAKAKDRFDENREFIKETIFNNLPEIKKEKLIKAKNIYLNIKNGIPYRNTNNTIILPNEAEIDKYYKILRSNNQKLNYRFNGLLTEFKDYVTNKNNEETESEDFAPMELVRPTRVLINRQGKGKVGYSGSTSSNTDRKKKRKLIPTTNDESDVVKIYPCHSYYLSSPFIFLLHVRTMTLKIPNMELNAERFKR